MQRTTIPGLFLAALLPLAAGASEGGFAAVKPILDEYCLTCHSTAKQKGDFDLEIHASPAGLKKHPKVFQQVVQQMLDGEMPPKDKKQPSPAQRELLLTWIRTALDTVARERAGDPGPVVLRRLSNAEYTYTVRDLTGIDSLDPTREFPVDGAAGEGFTNTGMSLVMSPALVTKFLDAGKDVARHALLTPDGLRWTAGTSRRDGTDDLLREIRAFYARHAVAGEAGTVKLQGIPLDRSHGSKLPLDRYLAAALELRAGGDPAPLAAARGLSAKYLTSLRDFLATADPAELGDGPRAHWKAAQADDLPALVAGIERWQRALFRFHPVGEVGRPKGPARWMEPISPLVTSHEVRLKLPERNDGSDQVLALVAEHAGAGHPALVTWRDARLALPGRGQVALREVGPLVDALLQRRALALGSIAEVLAAAAEAKAAETPDLPALARKHGIDVATLGRWLDWLGFSAGANPDLAYLKERVESSGPHAFVRGWRTGELPTLLTNSSDSEVRIPGRLKAHGVVVHPTPQLAVAVGWRSPLAGSVRVAGLVVDAHHDCGNGVTWALERRRGSHRQRLASGIAERNDAGKDSAKIAPTTVAVRPGDLLALVIGPRDAEHTCDLTELELTIDADDGRSWSLGKELSGDPLAGNPHADAAGTPGIWHIYSEPATAGGSATPIPEGSLLAR